ncbi:MAG: mechanosensitive ion channel, partial [Spirochaetales bacterium]|nr:mechanosensitive ion channel [Spirochaetales bacterium]
MNDFLDLLGGIFLTPITLGAVKLPFHLLQFILEFLLPLLLAFGVYKLALYGLKRLLSSLKAKEQASTLVHKWVRIVFRICWLILFIILIGRLFGAAIGEYFQKFYAFLNQPILSSESTTISFVTIILMIPLFYLASWAGKMSRGLVNHAFLDRLGLDESRRYTLTKLVRYTVVVLVLLIGLSVIGIDLSILTVFFGVLGIGLGFGLQHTVANFFAGIVIIFSRPIKVGDKILVDDIEGTVMEVKALSTVINTLTEETILLPNSHLVHNMVHNYSYRSRRIIISNTV